MFDELIEGTHEAKLVEGTHEAKLIEGRLG